MEESIDDKVLEKYYLLKVNVFQVNSLFYSNYFNHIFFSDDHKPDLQTEYGE